MNKNKLLLISYFIQTVKKVKRNRQNITKLVVVCTLYSINERVNNLNKQLLYLYLLKF